jgi:hypothetical protein
MTTLTDVRARALAALIPPLRLALSARIEDNIRLPSDVSALPGFGEIQSPKSPRGVRSSPNSGHVAALQRNDAKGRQRK